MGLSAGIDPTGRIRGWLSSNESKDRVLLVTLPAASVFTLYSRIGDVTVAMAALYILALIVYRIWKSYF
jgi:apolipoprotein N-acyltransferase